MTCNHIFVEISTTRRCFPDHKLFTGYAQPVLACPLRNSRMNQNLALCLVIVWKMPHPGKQFPRILQEHPNGLCIFGIPGKPCFFFCKFPEMPGAKKAAQRSIIAVGIGQQPLRVPILFHTADMPVYIRILFQPVQQRFLVVSQQGNYFLRSIYLLQRFYLFQHFPAVRPVIYVITQ